MAITSLQEKQNRKFYVPIRPGNRGGWSLFNWDQVRDKPYRDREMYLGNSAVIGVLDKGGKWRKRDWYLKTDKKYKDKGLTSEQEEAIRRDKERLNSVLGNQDADDQEALTEQEMKELLKRIKNKDDPETFRDAKGLGFDQTKVQIRAKPTISNGVSATRLEGFDEMDEVKVNPKTQHKRERSEQRNSDRSESKRKSKKQKKEKKQNKQKKQKKQKKEKKHKRHRSSSSESRGDRDNNHERSRNKRQRHDSSVSSEKNRNRSKGNHERRRHD